MTSKPATAYLAEVFGFPADVRDPDVELFRSQQLCPFRPLHADARRDLSTPDTVTPFTQQFARCTKDSKVAPLGVCSVYVGGQPAITCPVRFSEGGVMLATAAAWIAPVLGVPLLSIEIIPEVRLVPAATSAEQPLSRFTGSSDPAAEPSTSTGPELRDTSAGNIDYVLASIDADQSGSLFLADYAVNAYGALEVQAVYISGNVGNLFREYMGGPAWDGLNPPRPDWLSSSRKRLVPQLAWKGSVLHAWGKPIAVCVQDAFWNTMPYLSAVTTPTDNAHELAWIIIDLERTGRIFQLVHLKTVYSEFGAALSAATQTPAGSDHLVRAAILGKYIKSKTGKTPKQSRSAVGARPKPRKPRS
jgi:Restriction endonuclease NotI